jgi:hypothetical protein
MIDAPHWSPRAMGAPDVVNVTDSIAIRNNKTQKMMVNFFLSTKKKTSSSPVGQLE